MSDAATPRIEQVCPVVLRHSCGGLDILVFRHPDAGNQIVRGIAKAQEAPAAAALRELQHDSGLEAAGAPLDLGKSKGIDKGEAWHFFACPIPSAPDEWDHTPADEESVTYSFFWQPLDAFIDEDEWDATIIRAIRYAQSKVEKLDETVLARLAPKPDADLADRIMVMANERGADKTFCPSEVARSIAGKDEAEWRALMKPIRAEAVRLAQRGDVIIKRKGKPVDPADFKGIYRIALPETPDA